MKLIFRIISKFSKSFRVNKNLSLAENQKPEDVIPSGIISGTVSPVGSARSVIAESVSGINQDYRLTPHPYTGQFTFENLDIGLYHLSFIAAKDFIAPTGFIIKVSSKQNMNFGAFNFLPKINGSENATLQQHILHYDDRIYH